MAKGRRALRTPPSRATFRTVVEVPVKHESVDGECAESKVLPFAPNSRFSKHTLVTCASLAIPVRKAKSKQPHDVSSARQIEGFESKAPERDDDSRVDGAEVSSCPPPFINYVLRATLWQATVVIIVMWLNLRSAEGIWGTERRYRSRGTWGAIYLAMAMAS